MELRTPPRLRSTALRRVFLPQRYGSKRERNKQRHAFWTTVWLAHLGISQVPRLYSEATVQSIRQGFDRFEGSGRNGQRARKLARATRAAIWAAWRTSRSVDREHWTAMNFYKTRWGHKKVLQLAFPRIRKQLLLLGRELQS